MKSLRHGCLTVLVGCMLLSAFVLLPALATPEIPNLTTAPLAELNFYFGNLHSHTAYSDGTATPRDAFAHARDKAKLDFLAVTEHNHAKAEGTGFDPQGLHIALDHSLYNKLIDDANNANKTDSFVAIYGQEYSTMKTGGNHSNILMAKKVITTPNGRYRTVFTDTWMDEYGAQLIQLNHPWEAHVPASKIGSSTDVNYNFNQFPSKAAFVSAVEERATLIEVINGPGTKNPQSEPIGSNRNPAYYFQYLNMGLHLAPTADQDNHFKTWGTLTTARTVVLAPRLSREGILKALKERHVYASQDNDLEIRFTVNGHILGSRVGALSSGGEANISITIDDGDNSPSSYLVTVYYDNVPGGALALVAAQQKNVNNHQTITFEHTPKKGKGYYFLEITSVKGHNKGLMTWTAPVWFE